MCENRKEAAIFKIPREKSRFETKVTQVYEQKTRAMDKLRLHNASITLKKVPKLGRIQCTIKNKINGTPPPKKSVYVPISKLHWILAIESLRAHNNLSLCCYRQINFQCLK